MIGHMERTDKYVGLQESFLWVMATAIVDSSRTTEFLKCKFTIQAFQLLRCIFRDQHKIEVNKEIIRLWNDFVICKLCVVRKFRVQSLIRFIRFIVTETRHVPIKSVHIYAKLKTETEYAFCPWCDFCRDASAT